MSNTSQMSAKARIEALVDANSFVEIGYACLNYGEAYAPGEIAKKSICIGGDIGEILNQLWPVQSP